MSILKTNEIQTTAGKKILQSTGSVLQVIWKDLGSNRFTTTNNSATYRATGFTNTITPTSSSSKIFHTVSIGFKAICDGQIRVARGGTVISPSLMDSFRDVSDVGYQYDMPAYTFTWLDSPSTTSAINYELYIRATGCQGFMYIGSPGDFNSSWSLWEISA